ncbi:MAG: helix-turn-helix domain-containing protein [Clostridium sp.]
MSRKSRFTVEEKVKASTEYLLGLKSAALIASELNMGKRGINSIYKWAKQYKAFGSSVFTNKCRNNSYSREFKMRVVKEYLNGVASPNDLIIKYNIPARSTLMRWIKMYNNHIELKDYDPKPEVYMANTLKTTYEERLEIVRYCLDHDRDIKETAVKYGCKYAQLYQWIRKYEVDGEVALIDKRGKRKQENELSDLEKAERIIAKLEREKEEYRKKYELLKKAEELERW